MIVLTRSGFSTAHTVTRMCTFATAWVGCARSSIIPLGPLRKIPNLRFVPVSSGLRMRLANFGEPLLYLFSRWVDATQMCCFSSVDREPSPLSSSLLTGKSSISPKLLPRDSFLKEQCRIYMAVFHFLPFSGTVTDHHSRSAVPLPSSKRKLQR